MTAVQQGRPVAPLVFVALVTTGLLATLAPAAATATAPDVDGAGDARALLEAAAGAMDHGHIGRVSVVTFSDAGPRVADLEVRVGEVGAVELRRPTRWLVGAPGAGWLRTTSGTVALTPVPNQLGLDVDAVLTRWEATVGGVQRLDTGPATPVRLLRREGSPVSEVLWFDRDTALPVRRETRSAEGDVLRVVAYTSISLVDAGGPGQVHTEAAPVATHEVAALAELGYDIPRRLGAGFELLDVGHHDDIATARYGDGLSVLSVYQQHGDLDPSSLPGADVRAIAGRDVWTWGTGEPLRLVWTSEDRTWTVVSDAPLEVIEDALVALPGEHVGHDVPSRVARGLRRTWSWTRDLFPG